eukprot:3464752-Prymnesium_polylepis.1
MRGGVCAILGARRARRGARPNPPLRSPLSLTLSLALSLSPPSDLHPRPHPPPSAWQVPHYCPISSHYKWNLDGLMDKVFEYLAMTR